MTGFSGGGFCKESGLERGLRAEGWWRGGRNGEGGDGTAMTLSRDGEGEDTDSASLSRGGKGHGTASLPVSWDVRDCAADAAHSLRLRRGFYS